MANFLGGTVSIDDKLVSGAKGVVDWGLKDPRMGYLDGYLAASEVILSGDERHR